MCTRRSRNRMNSWCAGPGWLWQKGPVLPGKKSKWAARQSNSEAGSSRSVWNGFNGRYFVTSIILLRNIQCWLEIWRKNDAFDLLITQPMCRSSHRLIILFFGKDSTSWSWIETVNIVQLKFGIYYSLSNLFSFLTLDLLDLLLF